MPDVTRAVLYLLGLILLVGFLASTWRRSLRWVSQQSKERELPTWQQKFWRVLSYLSGPVAVALFAVFVPDENESRWDIFGSEETEIQTDPPEQTIVINTPAASNFIESDYFLRIRESNREPDQRVYRLVVGTNVIGRKPEQSVGVHSIRLNWDNAISSEHLRIDVQSNGLVQLFDLNSRYGTKVNGRPIEPNRTVRINVEDHISCGNTMIELSSRVVRIDLEQTQAPVNYGQQTEYMRISPLQLTVVRGSDAGRTLKLDGDQWIVGRSDDSSWSLRDRHSSKKHLEIRRDANVIQVRDLGSKRGTFINNRKVKKEFTILNIGDTLRVGSNQIRLERKMNAAPPQERRL